MRWVALVELALLAFCGGGAVVLSSSCSDDPAMISPAPPCASADPAKSSPVCTPLYEPSFDNVFARTLKPSCAKSGVSCHASTGRQGRLAFDDADESYRLLTETTQVVQPGDPACSILVARIASTNGQVRMPPGLSLAATEQCSIVQWIANGAKR